jgi:hypothetical protein
MAYSDRYDVEVDGVSLLTTYGLRLSKSTDLGEPAAKTYTVKIPGGNGVIDLTDALTGDVVYNTYTQKLVFYADLVDDMELRRRLMNRFHGKKLEYQLAIDPGYTYKGRFAVSVDKQGVSGAKVTITVTCDPYKLKEHCSYRLNATGGRLYRFESGRRPVHPTIECESVCFVTWQGETITVPAGTYRLNDVVFREGWNDLYVNSGRIWAETWADVGKGGKDVMTWAQASAYNWDDVQRLGVGDSEGVPQAWADLGVATWADEAAKTWADVDYRRTEDYLLGDSTVYLTYDWEDL